MRLSEEQFRERLVDYLYETLEGEELQAFEAYLRDSAEARRELAALQTTLRIARQGIAEALDDVPPAGVRSAVLAAAHAHAFVPAERGGLWRWLRAPWLVPALGVAAAVGLVVFGKSVEPPSLERVRDGKLAPSPALTAEPRPVPPPAAVTGLAAHDDAVREATREPPAADKQPAPAKAERRAAPARKSSEAEGGFAVPPPAWVAKRAQDSNAKAEQPRALAPAASGAARGRAERESEGVVDDLLSGEIGASRARDAPAASEAEAHGDLIAPAPARPFANDAPSAADGARADRKSAQAPDALVRRAHEHMLAKRWLQAQADYRELLRRYPDDTRAPSWKKWLALATQALHGDAR